MAKKSFMNKEGIGEDPKESFQQQLLARLEEFNICLDPDRKDQHLIVNPKAIDDLISFAEIDPADTVLEIGSGPGNITEKLAKRASRVYALEMDRRFKPLLDSLAAKSQNIRVVIGDFLKVELPEFDKVVANPPFSILEPMIQKLAGKRFDTATLIIGASYYRRVLAKPGSDDFTKTSLFTQANFSVECLRELGKEDFYPQSRQKAVILKLISLERGADPILQTLSDAFSEYAEKRVSSLVNDLPTPACLDIPQSILSKRLQELSNKEISQLTAKLLGFGRRRPHYKSD